jgi:hypothetical protein
LEKFQPIHVANYDKDCLEDNTKDVPKQPVNKIMNATSEINQPFHLRPGIEIALHQQLYCQF